jgi:hypothetical protein
VYHNHNCFKFTCFQVPTSPKKYVSSGVLFDHNGLGPDYGDSVSSSYVVPSVPIGFTFNYFQTPCTSVSVWRDGDVYLLTGANQFSNGYRVSAYHIKDGYNYPYYYRTETNTSQLYKLSSQIRSSSFNYATFAATSAFIITWFLSPNPQDPSAFNSFQLILATGVNFSFIVYNYEQLDQRVGSSYFIAPNNTVYNVNTGRASVVNRLNAPGVRAASNSLNPPARQVFRVDANAGIFMFFWQNSQEFQLFEVSS